MQAIVMTGSGGPEVLVPREVAAPRPGTGEVLIRAAAIPILFPETLLRAGAFPMASPPPVVFGHQVAGEIIDVGTDVSRDLIGRRVVAATTGTGSYAEFVCTPVGNTTPIPDDVSADDAAATMMSGSIAVALLETANLTGTETIVVEAGATGVGSYLVQLAEEFGAAQVIATAGGSAKTEHAYALGADQVIDHRTERWTETLTASAPDTIDVVFDSIGGTTAANLLGAMTPGSGRMLSYGWLSGAPAQVSAADLLPSGLTLTACAGPAWQQRADRARAEILARIPALAPPVETTLPLAAAARGHELVESRRPLGKVILRPDATV
ncbi:quinone oxidoreductase family protein [Nocardia carnea]|uniref:Zinc-binding alcohol dehydrogenase family protein n=1 Tax=Nocardia carnea TaxID=37328 RepID=A0ABW7TFS4_9NOCA|nr:zinc-binding dehydrogenase [Nocardia carnea]